MDLSVWGMLAVIFLLAFLVESLVEYLVGAPFEHVAALAPYKWLLMYASMAVGIVGAFVYQFDLLSILSQFVGVNIAVTTFGLILTGCAIGRGSNYLHDLVKRYFVKPGYLADDLAKTVAGND
jgi:hypothetical protein